MPRRRADWWLALRTAKLRTLMLTAFGFLLAATIPAKAVDLDEMTVVTMAGDGSWGVATAASAGEAIAGAIRDCKARPSAPKDCGAQIATTRGGWVIASLCGDHKIIVAAETRQAAQLATLIRESELKRLYARDMPPCMQVLTVDPRGAVLLEQAALNASPSAPAALTNRHRCIDAPVDVIAVSEGERRLACSAVSDALQLLGRCGISLRRPLRVEILSEVRHPFNGVILGLLDVKQDRVLITEEANVPSLVENTPFARLPLRDFYSLIVHEVVHGVMHQNLKRRLASHAEAEYPAYALQIESLAPHVRDRFLQFFGKAAAASDTFLFNDIALSADPFFFAASAYRHFKALGNGCGHLQALLAGEARFIATLPAGW